MESLRHNVKITFQLLAIHIYGWCWRGVTGCLKSVRFFLQDFQSPAVAWPRAISTAVGKNRMRAFKMKETCAELSILNLIELAPRALRRYTCRKQRDTSAYLIRAIYGWWRKLLWKVQIIKISCNAYMIPAQRRPDKEAQPLYPGCAFYKQNN